MKCNKKKKKRVIVDSALAEIWFDTESRLFSHSVYKALEWFSSTLSDRVQAIIASRWISSQRKVHYEVPRGSGLGPILFTLYIQPLSKVIS